jgi:hypothetical protein
MMLPSIYAALDRRWGPHSVDAFASPTSAQLPRFYAAWAAPQAAGVDAFAQPGWRAENSWCFPPFELLPQLAQLLRETGAAATVIAPRWPAQAWFQQLRELLSEVLELGSLADQVCCPGRLGGLAFAARPAWSAVAFRLEARPVCSQREWDTP